MNRLIVFDSLKVTFVVSMVLLMGCMMGDAVSEPVQIVLGANGQEIHDSQNITFISQNISLIVCSIIGTFVVSLLMLKYLQHGEN